jgi:hypothetical protein
MANYDDPIADETSGNGNASYSKRRMTTTKKKTPMMGVATVREMVMVMRNELVYVLTPAF